MTGKLIVIEGTDCSGKETQSNLLLKRLNESGIAATKLSFPMYDTPTGKIVGGPYLGKDYISEGWFKEGAVNVDPKVASLYYAADRKYNIYKITDLLNTGVNVILDRYVYSNMAHQAGKIVDVQKRIEMYNWLDMLEFKLLELPQPDIACFLHMPLEYAVKLREGRTEKADEHESDLEHLKLAENAYIELANRYKWETIECVKGNEILSIDDIGKQVFDIVTKKLEENNLGGYNGKR